jgi:hypothetical protein
MRCFIEIFNETKETAKTFGGALSDLVSLLVTFEFDNYGQLQSSPLMEAFVFHEQILF